MRSASQFSLREITYYYHKEGEQGFALPARCCMRIRFRNKKDVWVSAGIISLIACGSSQLAVFLLYLAGGADAFHMENAMLTALILPVLISVPITYFIGRTGIYLNEAQGELRRLADTDPLTGLSNRRSFFAEAKEVVEGGQRPCALLVLDADHFKDLNDNYGHAVGDAALISIADVLRSSFRSSDLICRVGGEEFAVLLPGISIEQATKMAQRLVDSVADSPLTIGNAIITYSVSCGVAGARANEELSEFFKRADDAMYAAKRFGRNRVVQHDQAA